MENRVVALAVLENLIHWPLANRSGYVVPNNTASAEDGGEEDNNNAATVSAGDADDLLREPRQRKLDRYRAVLLLPHLCQKLGSRWVESEVVPYLLRCVEEDDAQLSLVSGLALLGVTLPRRTPLGPSTAASPTSDTAAKAAPPATGGSSSSNSNNTAATAASPTSTASAYLSLEDVQPVCALLAASSTEETRAFTAQVVLPHLYFGTGLERDMSLESWDVKFVPLSVLHADMIASGSGGGGSGEDDGSPSAAAAAARAEEGDDDVATLRFISAVRQQLVRQRRMHAEQLKNGKGGGSSSSTTDTADGDTRPSTGAVSSSNASFSKLSAAVGVRSAWVAPTEDDVRRRCLALAAEDEQMQFLFSGSYDTLTGPWGFSGNRLVSLAQGSNVLFSSAESRSSNSNGSFTSRLGNGHNSSSSSCVPISAGGGFRCFRPHERRTNGSQVLRGDAPPASQRPLSEADLELYGASYAADSSSSSSGLVASCDDFFAVNVRARALMSDLVRWMEALATSGEADVLTSPVSQTSPTTGTNVSSSSTVSPPRQFVSLYDYVSYENRREALRGRWRGQLKVLQSLLESSYPGPVAVAVEVISGLLHALHFVLAEVEAFVLQRESGSSSHDAAAAGAASQRGDSGMSGRDVDASLWGIAVPTSPLLTTAQLQSFLYRTTRRHVAYSIAAAVTARKVAVPTSLTASADAAAWRTPTEALARLLRAALPVAQKALTELLFRHHLFDKLSPAVTTPTTTDGSSGGGGADVVLQMGAGPCEARAAALAAWDISFTPSTAQNSVSLMPDDASFLLTASPAVDTDAAASNLDRSLWLPGTLNAFSIFRVHRVIRRALLRAVPLCVDVSSLLSPSAGSGAIPPAVFTLSSVCPMLLQVLVPPGTLRTLLNVLHAAAKLPEDAVAGRHHVDPVTGTPVTLEVAVPDLWAAMTAPGSVMGVGQTAAAVEGQETPSSLDFGLLEAALDAVQRLVAEAARQLSSAAAAAAAAVTTPAKKPSTVKPPAMQAQQMAHAVCAQLFTLVAACVRWVPRYTNWKARWLIAQRLPRLTATFCFLLATVADIAGAAAVMWLQCTLQLLTSVWSCAEAFGVAPLNDLTDDEEVEVRCVAVRCGALLFRRVVETVLRVSAAVAPTSPSSGAPRVQATAASVVLLLPSLAEPLAQLLDATAQCVLVGANDVDPRVRCRSAEALAVLSRTLSVLVAADGRGKSGAAASNSMNGAGSEDAVWARYLRSNTDALLRLMSDEKPTVQLALVSQLTDLLLMGKRPLSPQQLPQGKSISLMGSREDVDSRLGEEDGEAEDAEHPRSAGQVQHEALLQCLRQLAQHELWRLREQYAVMLAHLCGRLLQSAMFPPFKVAGSAAMTSAVAGSRGRMAAAVPGDVLNASMQADVSPYGHTHPLYQLARTELLTLLVAVLFDKVKAVRDAALDAVERMCLQLAAAAQQNNNSLQRDFGSSLGLPSRGSNGESGAAVSGGRGGQAFNAVTSASSSALRNGSGSYNCNTFVDDVLWPRISAYDKAWETYLSRSALLHIALRLRVEKASVFIPLLDQLARDHVLNVRLVVAKIILEVLLRSAPDVSSAPWPLNKDGEDEGGAEIGGDNAHSASYKPDLPSGTVAYRILMNRPADPVLRGGGGGGVGGAGGVLPPLQFTEEERTGVILQILRQLLKDASSDVRDEAAKALKVCF